MNDAAADAGGCWAVYSYDVGPYLIAAYAIEIDALRHLNGLGYGYAVFLPWGLDLSDAIKQAEAS